MLIELNEWWVLHMLLRRSTVAILIDEDDGPVIYTYCYARRHVHDVARLAETHACEIERELRRLVHS